MQPIVKTERYIPIKVYKRENYWYGKWTVSEPTPRNKTEADKGLKPTSNIPEVFATHRGSCLWELRSYINRPGQEHSVHEMGVMHATISFAVQLKHVFFVAVYWTTHSWINLGQRVQIDSIPKHFKWIEADVPNFPGWTDFPGSAATMNQQWTNNEPTNIATWFMHAWFVKSAMCVPSGYWSECGRLNCSIQKRPCCVSSNLQKSAEPRPTGFLILICVQIQCATSIRQRALQLLGILVEFTMRCPS